MFSAPASDMEERAMSHGTSGFPARLAILGTLLLVLALTAPAVAQEGPPLLLPGSVSPAVLTAGEQAIQTVNLSRPAPPGGTLVRFSGDQLYQSLLLEGSGVGVARVVPEGHTSISFPVRFLTHVDVPRVVNIRASVSQSGIGYAANAQVTVVPPDPAVQAVVALEGPPSALAERGWPHPLATPSRAVTLDARLKRPAPAGGLVVTVFGSGAGNGVGISPERSYAFFPEGSTTTTLRVRVNTNSHPSQVQATLDLGISRVSWRTVAVPEQFAVGGVLGDRGSTVDGTVGLGNVDNPDGTTVQVRSDSAGVRVPAEVFVPPGQLGVRFPITIAGDAEGTDPFVTTTLTATWQGLTSTADLNIRGRVVPSPSPDPGQPPPPPEPSPTPSAEPGPAPPPSPTPSPASPPNASPRAVVDVSCRRAACSWDASRSTIREGTLAGAP